MAQDLLLSVRLIGRLIRLPSRNTDPVVSNLAPAHGSVNGHRRLDLARCPDRVYGSSGWFGQSSCSNETPDESHMRVMFSRAWIRPALTVTYRGWGSVSGDEDTVMVRTTTTLAISLRSSCCSSTSPRGAVAAQRFPRGAVSVGSDNGGAG